jgi:hypothetical protein
VKKNNQMKKGIVALSTLFVVLFSACHYGEDEAKKTIERNEQYKNENKDYSVNRAGEYGKKSTTDEVPTSSLDTVATK